MTLSPKLGVVGISTLWHFRLPLPIQMFIKVASSPRLSGIGMPSPILWSNPLKMQRIVLLSSLLWWELGTYSLITGPGEWLSFRRFTSNYPDPDPVWSESSLSAWRRLGSLATHWADSEDSDQTGRMLVLSCRGSNGLCKKTFILMFDRQLQLTTYVKQALASTLLLALVPIVFTPFNVYFYIYNYMYLALICTSDTM